MEASRKIQGKMLLIVMSALVALGWYGIANAQPTPCAGLKITSSDQFGNRPPSVEFSALLADGDVITGEVENGERTLCVPAGETNVEVLNQEQIVVTQLNVIKTVHFNLDLPLPSNEWLRLSLRGVVGVDRQAYGVWLDPAIFNTQGWRCQILGPVEEPIEGGCSSREVNATVAVLPPGEQTITVIALRDTSPDTISMTATIQVPETHRKQYLPQLDR